jgi:hypothetical protein
MASRGAASRRYRKVAAGLRDLPRDHVRSTVQELRGPAQRALAADTGGDGRLSGVRNGAPLRVQSGVLGDRYLVQGYVAAGPKRSRAQWFWLDRGVNPHRGRAGRGRHPGTKSKRTWSATVEPRVEPAQDRLRKRYTTIVRG